MRHSVRFGGSVVCALMLAACGGGKSDQARSTNGAADNPLLNSDSRPQPVTTTGCLTSANGRFVVTSLETTTAVPTTVTYQLTGGDAADLQKNVNREVRVAGEAEPPQVADVRQAPTPAVGTSGDSNANDQQGGVARNNQQRPEPRVKTQEAMRFAVRNLKVLSVTATGDECPAAAPAGQSAQ